MYDVVIAGGSIAGLLCAREISAGGHSVLVIEKDHEIGTPEHCSGLISTMALEELGVCAGLSMHEHKIESAQVSSPSGKSFTINSAKQKVVEISRRDLDKQVAHQAQKNGTQIMINTHLQEITKDGIKTNSTTIKCKIIVDARGITSIIQKDKTGILSSAQYEIHADWIKQGQIRVIFDNLKYPGFFAWVIPSSNGTGKVGVAGKGINSADRLEEFLVSQGKYSVTRKIFAPIWINGPIKNFIQNNLVIIGDAAGQTKPTTAGGIFSCGMGGIFAGRAIVKYLESGKQEDLLEYPKKWNEKFRKEFEKQLFARKILEKLNNYTIDKLFDSVTPQITQEISEKDNFDFHTSSIIKLLGIKTSLKTAQAILGGQIKKLLD